MIKYVDGDLLKLADEGCFDVIGQNCNCQNTMGAGIALQIKNKYPEVYVADCATKKGDEFKLGKISDAVVNRGEVSFVCVNLYGQFGYTGRRSGRMDLDYDALRSALKLTKEKYSGKKFGFNRFGADLAGGDWSIIESIIEEEYRGEYVTIVNYVPE